jgi:hypothetical protein
MWNTIAPPAAGRSGNTAQVGPGTASLAPKPPGTECRAAVGVRVRHPARDASHPAPDGRYPDYRESRAQAASSRDTEPRAQAAPIQGTTAAERPATTWTLPDCIQRPSLQARRLAYCVVSTPWTAARIQEPSLKARPWTAACVQGPSLKARPGRPLASKDQASRLAD